jgi:uncharacterized repeat protein (TIGR01451 family)
MTYRPGFHIEGGGASAARWPSLALALLALAIAAPADAQYVLRYSAIRSGAITFTGNTLGLDKAGGGSDQPGTNGSIGAFITTDTTQQKPGWPPGTTADWRRNRSAAVLRLPAGATVLHAELVWGGNFANKAPGGNLEGLLDTPVSLTTPLGTNAVSPDLNPLVRRQAGVVDAAGVCQTGLGAACYYTRVADVTALVRAAGGGTYAVGGVPGHVDGVEDNSNVAGWTLAVVYEQFGLGLRNLSLFAGLEGSGADPAVVTGFCTPPSGTLSGRLAVSAIEGDTKITGDKMLFGLSASLSDANRLSGPRNLIENFFGGQITDDAGQLDTTGTFGDRNHAPPVAIAGSRQGWDITNVDVSPQLRRNQTTAYAQGTTTGDGYTIVVLGLQIDIGGPRIQSPVKTVDKSSTFVGDTLTYSLTLINSGTADATSAVLFDPLPPGTSLVPGSVLINGAAAPGADPGAPGGIPLGTLAIGIPVTVQYRVTVNALPPLPLNSYTSSGFIRASFVSCAGQPTQTSDVPLNPVTTTVGRVTATKQVNLDALVTGQLARFAIIVHNTGSGPANGVTLTDPIPAGFVYVPGTTTLNLVAIPDVGGAMPFAAGALVNGAGSPPGRLEANDQAIVSFEVRAAVGATGPATNTATIDPDGAGVLPPFSVSASTTITPVTDLSIVKTGPPTATPGATIVYTTAITNNGPTDVPLATVQDPTPAGLVFVSNAGACTTAFPCSLPTVAVGQTRTITTTMSVPAAYTAPDPIANTATVGISSPGLVDYKSANDTSTAFTSIGAPVFDLTVTKSDGVDVVVAGATVTYTIDVANVGPSIAAGVRVQDLLPATLLDATWTCTATDLSTCPASGTGNIDTTITLQPGGSATFVLTARVSPAALQTVTNTIVVTGPPGTVDPTGATASDTNIVQPRADLSITKTGPATATPGGRVTYQVTVVNAGPSVARHVRVYDPARIDQVRLRGLPAGCITAFPCDLGDLAPGESRVIVAEFDVDANAVGSVQNQVVVVSPTPDPDTSNNVANASSTLSPSADLSITMNGPGQVVPGTDTTFTLTIVNLGPSAAQGVTVASITPPGVTFLVNSEDCATAFPCALGTLTVGELRVIRTSLRIPVDYASPDPLVNTATVSALTPDPDLANNTASASAGLQQPAVTIEADVSITKTGPPALVEAGGAMVFELVVTNNGPFAAAGVTVSDPTPAGLTFESNGGDCTTPFPCSLGTLAAGEVRRIQARFVSGGMPIVNVATVSSTTLDPNLANNRATSATPGSADIAVTKTRVGDLVAGQSVRYVITVTNNGPADVPAVLLTDPAPPGLAFAANTGACTIAFPCAIGPIVAGASLTMTSTFVVAAGTAPGTVITNVVTATADPPDPNAANNTAQATGTVEAPKDTDRDGTPDDCEVLAGLDPGRNDGAEDADGDGRTNAEECNGGTHPRGFFTYYLPEGAQNEFFFTHLVFGSIDAGGPALVRARRQGDDGSETGAWLELAPNGRTIVDARSLLASAGSFATVVESDRPLLAERTMDMVTGSAHADTALEVLNTSWYFAEGATTDGFKLFYLVQNPHDQPVTITVTYLLSSGPPITRTYPIAAHARLTLWLNDDPELDGRDFGAVIQSSPLPIAAQRSMYRDWEGTLAVAGASSSGTATLASEWFFAEGATGTFDLWLLLANFEAIPVETEVAYIVGAGQRILREVTIPPLSRVTVRVNDVDPALADSGVIAMHVRTTNQVQFMAERAMWWPGGVVASNWYEGHHGTPVTQTASHWRFGEALTDSGAQTFVLVANFGAVPGQVLLTLTYDDGSSSARVLDITGPGRLTLELNTLIPESVGRRYRIDVASHGLPLPLVAERSAYMNRQGRIWGAGSNIVGASVP